ncbi:Mediator of RNA polymerase II transcription subunit 17 [Bienertia sinuspersici]
MDNMELTPTSLLSFSSSLHFSIPSSFFFQFQYHCHFIISTYLNFILILIELALIGKLRLKDIFRSHCYFTTLCCFEIVV